MFFSDEPGFYKDGEFGIRIESVLRVVNLPFKDETYGKFVGFEPVTLVPFEPKLIDFSMMSPGQGSMKSSRCWDCTLVELNNSFMEI